MIDFNYVSFLKKPQRKERMCSSTCTELRRGTVHHQLTAGSGQRDSKKGPGGGSCYEILSEVRCSQATPARTFSSSCCLVLQYQMVLFIQVSVKIRSGVL